MKRHMLNHPLLIAIILSGFLVIFAACQGPSPLPNPRTAELRHVPKHRVDYDAITVYRQMPKVIKLLNWATLSSMDQTTAFRWNALTPADEQVVITARNNAYGGLDFQVRVGIYGNEAKEQEFRKALGLILGDLEAKKRDSVQTP